MRLGWAFKESTLRWVKECNMAQEVETFSKGLYSFQTISQSQKFLLTFVLHGGLPGVCSCLPWRETYT
jgi:hypothetical protein